MGLKNKRRNFLRAALIAGGGTGTEARTVEPQQAHRADLAELAPMLGIRGLSVTAVSITESIELVDATGRQSHPTKRGCVTGKPPALLARLGMDSPVHPPRARDQARTRLRPGVDFGLTKPLKSRSSQWTPARVPAFVGQGIDGCPRFFTANPRKAYWGASAA
ncbi:MAG: hypothetical protein IPK27_06625 [Rhodanobacteraceae bacterium]|nr:hypothetical protein [Rhodanobacteraceae bacterium]